MGKRKYSYLIYDDGKKERILNWFYASNDRRTTRIIVFTDNGTYLYVDIDKEIIPEVQPIKNNIYRPTYFYKLRGGVHNIDVSNVDIWYAVHNIDRMEIMMDLN